MGPWALMAHERRQSVENCSGALRAEVCLGVCLEVLPKISWISARNRNTRSESIENFLAALASLCLCVWLSLCVRVSVCLSSFACLAVACLFVRVSFCLSARVSLGVCTLPVTCHTEAPILADPKLFQAQQHKLTNKELTTTHKQHPCHSRLSLDMLIWKTFSHYPITPTVFSLPIKFERSSWQNILSFNLRVVCLNS